MSKIEFVEWMNETAKILNRKSIYRQAKLVAGVADGSNELEVLRGDEPRDCYMHGDSPSDYAKFLFQEWDLFGAEGE